MGLYKADRHTIEEQTQAQHNRQKETISCKICPTAVRSIHCCGTVRRPPITNIKVPGRLATYVRFLQLCEVFYSVNKNTV